MRVATMFVWRVKSASTAQAGSPTNPARWIIAEALRAAAVSLVMSVTSPSISSNRGWPTNSAIHSRPDTDHRRRRDRAEEHDGLPLPGRDPQPCVEARHDVPSDEQDRRHEERRGLSKGRRTGHEEGQEPDRRAHGGRAGGDVEENASFVRSEGGERPASIEARP